MIANLLFALVASLPSVYVHVDGSGYLRFGHSGHAVYCSKATLTVRNGLLATPEGDVLLPQIHIPADSAKLVVTLDGHVLAGPANHRTDVGQIVLALFPDGVGRDSMFSTSARATLSAPGDGVAGVIRGSTEATSAYTAAKQAFKGEIGLSGHLHIAVAPHSTIQKDEVFLGDVATIEGPKEKVDNLQGISLGPAPIYGVSRTFSEVYIVAKIRSAGLKPSEFDVDVPFGACVTRDSQTVTGDKLLQSALAAVAAQYEITNPLRSTAPIGDVQVQKGDLSIQATVARVEDQQVSVNVDIRVDGTLAATRTISLVASAQTVQIKSGDLVTIRLISGGATVELPGKARANGYLGQTIAVQSDTGSVLSAKVVDSGVVEVKF